MTEKWSGNVGAILFRERTNTATLMDGFHRISFARMEKERTENDGYSKEYRLCGYRTFVICNNISALYAFHNKEAMTMNELIDYEKVLDDLRYECTDSYDLHDEAADAIERLMAEVDRKDKALQAWVTTWESARGKLIENICQHCDTPAEERLNGMCEECPIIQPIRDIFDNRKEQK